MEKASENAPTNAKLIKLDSSIVRSSVKCSIGSTIPHQMEQQVTESSSMQGDTQALQKGELIIDALQQRLKESQEAVASLFTSLETETRNNAEIRSKLNITWETTESIREYINCISESRLSFEQRRVNSFALYENVIQKQKEANEKLQLDALKTKDLEDHVMQLKKELQLREKRLQEAMMEQSKLKEQLLNFEYELQLQKNEFNTSTEKKLMKRARADY